MEASHEYSKATRGHLKDFCSFGVISIGKDIAACFQVVTGPDLYVCALQYPGGVGCIRDD